MSGSTAWNPASASAGSWSRQEYQDSGKPWHSKTRGPVPCSAKCMRMPFVSTVRWPIWVIDDLLSRWITWIVSSPAGDHQSTGVNMARLQPITSKEQVPAKDHAIVDAIAQSRGALQGPFTMFLHCPELAGRVAHLGAFVRFEGSLDMRVRVLAAMTVARELGAVYVGGAQTGGTRRLGVTDTTITAIRERHSRGIPPEDAQIVDFTRELIRKHRVDDATFKTLRTRLGDDGFIQLTGAIGYYSMLSMTVNACELEAAPGAEVLQ